MRGREGVSGWGCVERQAGAVNRVAETGRIHRKNEQCMTNRHFTPVSTHFGGGCGLGCSVSDAALFLSTE